MISRFFLSSISSMELTVFESISSRKIVYDFLFLPYILCLFILFFGIRVLYIFICIFLIPPTGRLNTMWQEFSECNIDISIFDCYRKFAYRQLHPLYCLKNGKYSCKKWVGNMVTVMNPCHTDCLISLESHGNR